MQKESVELPNVFITINSPGEIEGWLKPVAKRLKEIKPDLKITVFLTPCRFASGQEHNVIQNIREIDDVKGKKDLFKFLFSKRVSKDKGVVLFLGGDILFPILLKLKMHWPGVAYTYKLKPWPWYKLFNSFFCRSDIGNLMVDAFKKKEQMSNDFSELDVDRNSKKIMFFPGSRINHCRNILPFIAGVGNIIKGMEPSFNLFIGLSPYIDRELANEILKESDFSAFNLIYDMKQDYLGMVDLLITLPGTSTAIAAVMQVPMLVILPFNWPELIQYEGALGLVANIPYFGKYIKKIILPIANRYIKYTAIPNIEAKEMIVPEIRKVVTKEEIAHEIINLTKNEDKLITIKKKLKNIIGRVGAAEIICHEVIRLM